MKKACSQHPNRKLPDVPPVCRCTWRQTWNSYPAVSSHIVHGHAGCASSPFTPRCVPGAVRGEMPCFPSVRSAQHSDQGEVALSVRRCCGVNAGRSSGYPAPSITHYTDAQLFNTLPAPLNQNNSLSNLKASLSLTLFISFHRWILNYFFQHEGKKKRIRFYSLFIHISSKLWTEYSKPEWFL